MESRKILKSLSLRQLLIGKYVLAVVLLVVFIAGTCSYLSAVKAKLSAREREFSEFSEKMEAYTRGLLETGPIKQRLAGSGGAASPVAAMEEIGRELGLKNNLSSFKGAEESLSEGYKIGSVEVSLKDITINQFVNLLYEIERYPGLLLVKELDLETGFEDNKTLDCTLKVLLIQRAAS
ncbi:MAG: hypothetical protein ACE5DW_03055 [Thermodesulfobacteriota bacterium]